MRKLVTRLQAQLDLEEAVSWYESRRPDLGLRFLDECDYVMRRIAAAPLQFPLIQSGARRALLKRFPYSVYFVAGDEQIEVIAILHQHRHPDTWKNRL